MILGAIPYTVTRYAAPADREDVIDGVTGRPAALSPSTFAILASVQPMDGEERERLPELDRDKDARIVFTETRLRTVDGDAGTPPDTIEIEGRPFAVRLVQFFDAVLPHYEVVVVRVEEEDPDA